MKGHSSKRSISDKLDKIYLRWKMIFGEKDIFRSTSVKDDLIYIPFQICIYIYIFNINFIRFEYFVNIKIGFIVCT